MSSFTEIRFKGSPEEVNHQWLEARKRGIGGSDAAAVLGMSKYATPLTVWLQKTGREESPDLSGKESVYWGSALEDVVAKEFQKRHPELKVKRKNALLKSKKYPWMLASVDRVITDTQGRKGVLEIKTCDKRLTKDWEVSVPDYYIPQPTHYLAVTGYEFFAVAVLIGGNAYKEFFFDRDEEDITALIEREDVFWNDFVLKDVMPAVTGTKADADALVGMYPKPEDEFIQMLDQDMPELGRIQELSTQKDALTTLIKELSNKVKARIGEHRGIQTPTQKVIWVRSRSTSFDRPSFEVDYPNVYDQYTTTKPKDQGLRITEE